MHEYSRESLMDTWVLREYCLIRYSDWSECVYVCACGSVKEWQLSCWFERQLYCVKDTESMLDFGVNSGSCVNGFGSL